MKRPLHSDEQIRAWHEAYAAGERITALARRLGMLHCGGKPNVSFLTRGFRR